MLWRGLWIAIIWCLCEQRNRENSKDGKADAEVLHMAQLKIWTWMKNKIPAVKFSYTDWYLCPVECIKTLR